MKHCKSAQMIRIAANYLARKGKLKLAQAVVDQQKENVRLSAEGAAKDKIISDIYDLTVESKVWFTVKALRNIVHQIAHYCRRDRASTQRDIGQEVQEDK